MAKSSGFPPRQTDDAYKQAYECEKPKYQASSCFEALKDLRLMGRRVLHFTRGTPKSSLMDIHG